MKTLSIILLTCIYTSCLNAQISGSMRSGYAFKSKDLFISGSMYLSAHNISLIPELIISNKDDKPAYFGLKASYQYKFIEMGAGHYFALLSVDAYDKDKVNGWHTSLFTAIHYKSWFIQYEYLRGNRLSIGVKEKLWNLQ